MSNLLSGMPVLRENGGFEVSTILEKSKTDSIIHAPTNESLPEVDDYPDGGLRAWMVVCGVNIFFDIFSSG